MTVKQAIKIVVGKAGNDLTIHTVDLKKEVWALLDHKFPMDTTITRKMRNLRNEGYKVECLSKKESKYRITLVCKEPTDQIPNYTQCCKHSTRN